MCVHMLVCYKAFVVEIGLHCRWFICRSCWTLSAFRVTSLYLSYFARLDLAALPCRERHVCEWSPNRHTAALSDVFVLAGERRRDEVNLMGVKLGKAVKMYVLGNTIADFLVRGTIY